MRQKVFHLVIDGRKSEQCCAHSLLEAADILMRPHRPFRPVQTGRTFVEYVAKNIPMRVEEEVK